MITNEFFLAAFTGQLSTLRTKGGLAVSFKRPYPRIENGRAYNFQYNLETGVVRLIPLIS